MTAAKDILDKAKWGQLTGAEINALGLALSDPNEPDLYTVIHAIGKAELKQYIPNQPEDTRFDLLWKKHFSHLQQRG